MQTDLVCPVHRHEFTLFFLSYRIELFHLILCVVSKEWLIRVDRSRILLEEEAVEPCCVLFLLAQWFGAALTLCLLLLRR